ncbi:MAG: hypothetical protein HYV07_07605 [Deltaproteobacteria bacterium]|nr:hypothetical protein [Deltaproteobacteria bacterium]
MNGKTVTWLFAVLFLCALAGVGLDVIARPLAFAAAVIAAFAVMLGGKETPVRLAMVSMVMIAVATFWGLFSFAARAAVADVVGSNAFLSVVAVLFFIALLTGGVWMAAQFADKKPAKALRPKARRRAHLIEGELTKGSHAPSESSREPRSGSDDLGLFR